MSSSLFFRFAPPADGVSSVDNIETNVRSVASDTRNASVQLTEAHAYQRRAGRRMFCLFLVFLLVLSIVLLAVSAHKFDPQPKWF